MGLNQGMENRDSIVPTSSLISANRFDLGSKLACVDWMNMTNAPLTNSPCEVLYKKFTYAITQSHFSEPNSDKKGFDDYIKGFEALYTAIKKNGFDSKVSTVPIADNGTILNGAHRTAILANQGIENTPIDKAGLPPLNYKWTYFQKAGIEPLYLDISARAMLEYSDDAYVACLWPSSSQHHEKLLSKLEPHSFYEKKLVLTDNGKINLLIHLYPHENWIGKPENGFQGIDGKIDACFKGGSTVTLVFLNKLTLKEVSILKDDLRSIAGIGKHSIHITDTPYEALSIGRTALSRDAEQTLNLCMPWKYPGFFRDILDFGNRVVEDEKNYAISGSALCGIFGQRKPKDIDFIFCGNDDKSIKSASSGHLEWSNHIDQLDYYGENPEKLIGNPFEIIYLFNTRFLSPDIIVNMKRRRGEKKDIADINILKNLQQPTMNLRTYLSRLYRIVSSRLRWTILSVLRKLGLYDHIFKMYQNFRK